MDKLRSLQYFIAAAEEGSFSAAARRFDVSVPAVAKLVTALERTLGTPLFERSSRGMALTPSGQAYLERCVPALDALAQADDQARGSGSRPRGTVIVGVQHLVAMNILIDALPRFRARYPEIQLDLRNVTQATFDEEGRAVDVFLSLVWSEIPDLIHRRLGQGRFVVVASPQYLAAHGVPRHPSELAAHECLLIRTQRGAVMDLWNFTRDGEKVSVTVKGWMVASNTLRDAVVRLVAAGHGIARLVDLANIDDFASGRLVTLLDDWRADDAPPITMSYWPSRRRIARVRAFVDFLVEIFGELNLRGAGMPPNAEPRWSTYRGGRASAIMGRVRSTS
jgi:LysR family transcriptional regulator, regulator for bpeEF and oprC